MSTKKERHLEIRKVINASKIHRQEELLSLLVNRGFDTTQATLSRDLRELKVGKIHDAHYGSIYFVPEEIQLLQGEQKPPLQGIVSLEFSANTAVLKTLSGFANSVAVKIDAKEMPEIIGSIAGNDTLLMVLKEGVTKEKVLKTMGSHFPELLDILV
ncbi:MAG: ArgR family transcriptional regulator [Bacteroidales bacterium]|nr:ArgR family transcriptional regulator [Bacteroidales bacterium]